RDDLVTGVQTCALPILEVKKVTLLPIAIAPVKPQMGEIARFEVGSGQFPRQSSRKRAAALQIEMFPEHLSLVFQTSLFLRVHIQIGRASCRERVHVALM